MTIGPLTREDELIRLAQHVTGMPWLNGAAYDGYHGLSSGRRAAWKAAGDAVDDIADVIQWLREEKLYAQADRLRTIAGRLARSIPAREGEPADAVRVIARGWK